MVRYLPCDEDRSQMRREYVVISQTILLPSQEHIPLDRPFERTDVLPRRREEGELHPIVYAERHGSR